MPNWTKEQQEAIDKEGKNIIVSAGAGSGKTAVLSERALRKVKGGVDIDKLLILTFTKAAAYEMMIRIREKLKEAGLTDQLEKIEKAYITTFDSFALSIVKKYHSVLNISSQVSIIDENIMSLTKEQYLNEIFEELYHSGNSKFDHLIRDFCMKDDQELKKSILKVNEKLDMKYDKEEYLNNYLKRFEDKQLEEGVKEFERLLKRELDTIYKELDIIRQEVDGDFYDQFLSTLRPLLESTTYDELRQAMDDWNPPRLPNQSSDTVKKSKKRIKDLVDSLSEKCIYEDSKDILETILSTKDYIEIMIEIIRMLDQKILKYKYEHDAFEFVDISKLVIQLVLDYEDIRKEIKDSFEEIMIDEYQDTSDLQEEFIRLIENDNVYMVGDIKQSIYRFRNANPYIFKNKYDSYSKDIGGYKIDLVKNFRSRSEVLEDINHIFNLIMDDEFGGAEYASSHQMVFGNESYQNEGKTNQPYQMEFYNYTYSKESTYTKEETEIFIIAHDIKEKIRNHYQIFDGKNKVLRDIRYQDFVILLDKSRDFPLYKKIFEYEKIPLTVLRDENIMDQMEIYLVHHLIELLLKGSKREFDDTFRYSFLSIGRSYLFCMSDQELFDILKEKTYQDTEIYHHLEPLFSKIHTLDIENILIQLIEEFGFYTKLIRVGNVELSTNNLEYIIQMASNLKNIGYTLEEFSSFLKQMVDHKEEIKIPMNSESTNSVQIMTIHKSKGLEYPICYFPGLSSSFNVKELKEKILFDNTYGIITPYFKEGYGDTIYKTLLKDKYYRDEISEKIRLFYVAVTRCKEKMIFVADLNEEDNHLEDGVVEDHFRLKYRSFLDFLKSIYEQLTDYIKEIDLSRIPMSQDYKKRNSKNLKEIIEPTAERISVSEIQIVEEEQEKEKFSKNIHELLSKSGQKNITLGKEIHRALEYLDFNQPDFSNIDSWVANKIKKLLDLPILSKRKDATIYKEYEFIENREGKELHGVIDLMLVYPDHIDIIDYKLKKITDDQYQKQLKGYQTYIESVTKKKTRIYLYSILDENLSEL